MTDAVPNTRRSVETLSSRRRRADPRVAVFPSASRANVPPRGQEEGGRGGERESSAARWRMGLDGGVRVVYDTCYQ